MRKPIAVVVVAVGMAAMSMVSAVAEASDVVCRVVAKDTWYGFDRKVFEFQGQEAWIVEPKKEAEGRPWIWSDYVWNHKDEFLKRMPRSVLQSNWYYGAAFESDASGKCLADVEAYEWLDKAGFDQIPTGSNFSCDTNFADTVKFCDAHCNQDRLKGYMMAPWTRTFAIHEEKSMQAISQMAEAIKARKA